MAARIALTLAAGVSVALAAVPSCNNATTTLLTPADATALAACKTFTGSIVLATSFPGPVAELDGTEVIQGDVTLANNSHITTISAPQLTTITGDCILDNLPLLANITLPQWASVDTLTLSQIPTPDYLDMQTTFQQVTNLFILNTTLQALPGLLLAGAQMQTLHVIGNRFLQTALFGAGNITKEIVVLNNGGQMDLAMGNLTWAYSMNISNASSISLPKLESVTSTLDLSWNSASEITIPNLGYIGSDLVMGHNAMLTNVSFPQLVNVQGSVVISNNTQFTNVTGFPALASVGGTLVAQGEYRDISFPALDTAAHGVQLSSENSFDCSDLPAAKHEFGCNQEVRVLTGVLPSNASNPAAPAAPAAAAPTPSTKATTSATDTWHAVASSTATPAPSTTAAPSDHHLSIAAVAGIIAGSVAGAGLLIGIVSIIILRCCIQRDPRPETPLRNSEMTYNPPEYGTPYYTEDNRPRTPAVPPKSSLRSIQDTNSNSSVAMSRESSRNTGPPDHLPPLREWSPLTHMPSLRSMSVYSMDPARPF